MGAESQATIATCMRLPVKTKGAFTYTEIMNMSYLERSMALDLYKENVDEIMKLKIPAQLAIMV